MPSICDVPRWPEFRSWLAYGMPGIVAGISQAVHLASEQVDKFSALSSVEMDAAAVEAKKGCGFNACGGLHDDVCAITGAGTVGTLSNSLSEPSSVLKSKESV